MVSKTDVDVILAAAKAAPKGPLVAVFVGGTSGIGEETCCAVAEATREPRLYVVGRSEAAAQRVEARVKALNPAATVDFIQADLSLLRNAQSVADTILKRESKVNLVVLSCGGLSIQAYAETAEGIDTKLSLHYLTRFKVLDSLLPALDRAGEAGEMATAVSVLAVGNEAVPDYENLDLRRSSSILLSSKLTPTLTSLAMMHLATAHPRVSFIHTMPGLVHTDVGRALPRALRWLMTPLWLFSTSAVTSGRYHACAVLNTANSPGVHLLDSSLQPRTNVADNGISANDGPARVWTFTQNVFQQVASSGKYSGMPADLFSSFPPVK